MSIGDLVRATTSEEPCGSKQFDVQGKYPSGTAYNMIAARHGADHYKALWSEVYQSKNDFFPGYGWFTDLSGNFISEEAAKMAFEKLRKAIEEQDLLE